MIKKKNILKKIKTNLMKIKNIKIGQNKKYIGFFFFFIQYFFDWIDELLLLLLSFDLLFFYIEINVNHLKINNLQSTI